MRRLDRFDLTLKWFGFITCTLGGGLIGAGLVQVLTRGAWGPFLLGLATFVIGNVVMGWRCTYTYLMWRHTRGHIRALRDAQ